MSSRAIRALRKDLAHSDTEIRSTIEDEEDDESEEEVEQHRRAAAFTTGMMDGSDADDSSSSTSDGEGEDERVTSTDCKREEEEVKPPATVQSVDEEDEDLDAILSEFQEKDNTQPLQNDQIQAVGHEMSPFDLILASFDTRDLDYEYSMRTSILLNSGGELESSYSQQRQRKSPLFGPPGDGWIRPPRLVGGGISMTTYEIDSSRPLPWPYTTEKTPASQWYTYVHSDIYERDLHDYTTVVQQSGDLNVLVMFVAHHPYVTAALLQLAHVLYQTNHSQEGLALLRRCLWVFESSALASFINRISHGKVLLMDKDQPENAVFFQALFRLVQVSNIAGYDEFVSRITLMCFAPYSNENFFLMLLFVAAAQSFANRVGCFQAPPFIGSAPRPNEYSLSSRLPCNSNESHV
jgi:Transcriptional repressor TCF25